jgi:hypothetical protein
MKASKDHLLIMSQALFLVLNICSFIGAMNGAGGTSADFKNRETYRTALLVRKACFENT